MAAILTAYLAQIGINKYLKPWARLTQRAPDGAIAPRYAAHFANFREIILASLVRPPRR